MTSLSIFISFNYFVVTTCFNYAVVNGFRAISYIKFVYNLIVSFNIQAGLDHCKLIIVPREQNCD